MRLPSKAALQAHATQGQCAFLQLFQLEARVGHDVFLAPERVTTMTVRHFQIKRQVNRVFLARLRPRQFVGLFFDLQIAHFDHHIAAVGAVLATLGLANVSQKVLD